MPLVSLVNESNDVVHVEVLHDMTFRTFAKMVLQEPNAIFFSPQGLVFPEDGNVAVLSLPTHIVHYMSYKREWKENEASSSSRKVSVDDVPFLHLPENREVLLWLSRGLDDFESCLRPKYMTLDQEVRVFFSSPLKVRVIQEDGNTTSFHVWEWIRRLETSSFCIKCTTTFATDRFEYLSSLDGNIHICRLSLRDDDKDSTWSTKKQRCS